MNYIDGMRLLLSVPRSFSTSCVLVLGFPAVSKFRLRYMTYNFMSRVTDAENNLIDVLVNPVRSYIHFFRAVQSLANMSASNRQTDRQSEDVCVFAHVIAWGGS